MFNRHVAPLRLEVAVLRKRHARRTAHKRVFLEEHVHVWVTACALRPRDALVRTEKYNRGSLLHPNERLISILPLLF